MSDHDPYSASRIGRGVVYLVGGKAVTSIAGIGTFLLLVGMLPVEQFAAYTVLFGLIELVDAVAGVGLVQVMVRYVPELFVGHKVATLRRLVGVLVAARIGVLVLLGALGYLFAPTIAPMIGLSDWEWAFRAYLLIVFLRVISIMLFAVLESMLFQGVAQMGFGFVTATRFGLLAVVAMQGGLTLQEVIVVELLTELAGLSIMALGVRRKLPRRARGEDDEPSLWLRANLRRMVDYGAKGYLQHLLILPYGSSVNRLVVGGSLASPEVALFGFAQSVGDLMERYLPVRLLAGVIRPVLTARYVRDRVFEHLEVAANLIFKINAVVICLAAVVVFAGGVPMVSQFTNGKYGEGGVGLLLVMCALVLMYSVRHMLDQVCQAVERNEPLIWSNALTTLSILPGIALLPVLGVYAMPAANIAGIVLGCVVLVWRLRVAGFPYRHDLVGLVKLLMATAIGMGVAEAILLAAQVHWIVPAFAGGAAYVAAAWLLKVASPRERELLASMRAARRGLRESPSAGA